MTAKPILLSGPMVRVILDGRKTQTRRVLKPQPICYQDPPSFSWGKYSGLWPDDWFGYGNEIDGALPYLPGDRLWVRETFGVEPRRYICPEGTDVGGFFSEEVFYRCDDPLLPGMTWRPSTNMPRWASRLTLVVTDVRVQRLQGISEEDATAEGVGAVSLADVPRQAAWSRRQDFSRLWDSLNAKRGFAWDSNPWIVAVTFTAHQRNIDSLEQAA